MLFVVKNYNDNKGSILLLLNLAIVALLGISALAIDVGYVWQERIRIQSAADAIALASVRVVKNSDDVVTAEARSIASLNGLQSSEYTIKCGLYEPDSHKFTKCSNSCTGGDLYCCNSCASTNTNAVIVEATRTVPSFFARIIGVNTLTPNVKSIAMTISSNSGNCLRPLSMLGGPSGPLNNKKVGDTITICGTDGGSSQSAGNWGKIAFNGINMSSGNAFGDAMIHGICHQGAAINQEADLETGFGGSISKVLESIVDNKTNQFMTFAVVSSIPKGNGNGNKEEKSIITGFVRVSFLSKSDQSGKGNNWCANFRLDAINVDPSDGGGSTASTRRYLPFIPA